MTRNTKCVYSTSHKNSSTHDIIGFFFFYITISESKRDETKRPPKDSGGPELLSNNSSGGNRKMQSNSSGTVHSNFETSKRKSRNAVALPRFFSFSICTKQPKGKEILVATVWLFYLQDSLVAHTERDNSMHSKEEKKKKESVYIIHFVDTDTRENGSLLSSELLYVPIDSASSLVFLF